jgi:hypothetical protein
MNERWQPIPGFDARYEVSDRGRVRAVSYTDSYGRRHESRMVAVAVTRSRYPAAYLGRAGARKHLLVHRLVAAAFVPNPHGYPEVNHIDGVKTHNDAVNLEWCTRSMNLKHAHRTGLSRMPDRWATRRTA